MYEINFDIYKFCDLTDEYVDQTAQLLNQEWSTLDLIERKLRLEHSIVKNYKENELIMPVSLLLINTSTNKVIGHVSLYIITLLTDNNSLGSFMHVPYIGSVIIDKESRGKGLGFLLLEMAENYLRLYRQQDNVTIRNVNFNFVYLETEDKQKFYEAIGFLEIEPQCVIKKLNVKNVNENEFIEYEYETAVDTKMTWYTKSLDNVEK